MLFLYNPTIRFHWCRIRYFFLKKNTKFNEHLESASFDKKIFEYNYEAIDNPAAFGCGGRMSICLHSVYSFFFPDEGKKLLIIGPRTEDDIFLARSIGFKDVRGLDLFSYSPYIDIGDMHCTNYESGTFDAVILAWVLPYTKDPKKMIDEAKRIVKSGGLICLGWHYLANKKILEEWISDIRGNAINSTVEIINLMGLEVVMKMDPGSHADFQKVLIFRNTEK